MMKKVVFCVALIMIIMSCASGRTAVVEANSNSPGIDLDAAIREAAAQMGEHLPEGTKIALVSMASYSEQLSEYIISRLEAALVSSRKLVVVDRANLDKVREEQGFQLSGEVDDDSAKSIGKLLGAGAIVTGGFADLGDVYSLTLKAINIETATVAVSYPADIARSARIETMLASGGGAGTGGGPRPRTAQAGGRAAPVADPSPESAKAYRIGDEGPAGGIIFYDKFSSAGGWRYLEAAPVATEQKFPWGSVSVGGTSPALGDGKKNTQLIVEELRKNRIGGAARYCDELEYGGYADWFMPSRDELDLMYRNLKEERGLGGFSSDEYWSSTQIIHQKFSDGQQYDWYYVGGHKNTAFAVRPIRQF
jgi:hypothetical protein